MPRKSFSVLYNEQINLMKDKGFSPVTKMQKYQQGFSNILDKSGKILSYQESVSKLSKRGFTISKANYYSQLKDLKEKIGEQATYEGREEAIRQNLMNTIAEMEDVLDTSIDIDKLSKLSTKELSDLFREANALTAKTKPSNNDWYENLASLLDKRLE